MDNREVIRRLFFMLYVAAVAAVAITTALISLVVGRTQIANISMLYLVAVLVVAVAYGRAAAIVASVLAFLTFDWFFVPPTHQLVVADAQELFSLALFLHSQTAFRLKLALLFRPDTIVIDVPYHPRES
jgi:K+-sensing histidine kinase KdpD